MGDGTDNIFTVYESTYEEFTVTAAAHPIHIHVNPLQVVTDNDPWNQPGDRPYKPPKAHKHRPDVDTVTADSFAATLCPASPAMLVMSLPAAAITHPALTAWLADPLARRLDGRDLLQRGLPVETCINSPLCSTLWRLRAVVSPVSQWGEDRTFMVVVSLLQAASGRPCRHRHHPLPLAEP